MQEFEGGGFHRVDAHILHCARFVQRRGGDLFQAAAAQGARARAIGSPDALVGGAEQGERGRAHGGGDVGQRIVVADAQRGALHESGGGEQVEVFAEIERRHAVGVEAHDDGAGDGRVAKGGAEHDDAGAGERAIGEAAGDGGETVARPAFVFSDTSGGEHQQRGVGRDPCGGGAGGVVEPNLRREWADGFEGCGPFLGAVAQHGGGPERDAAASRQRCPHDAAARVDDQIEARAGKIDPEAPTHEFGVRERVQCGKAGRGAEQRSGFRRADDSERIALAHGVRYGARSEHRLAEVGGREEQERGHGEAGLGPARVNAKSTNQIVQRVATRAQQGQVEPMTAPARLDRSLIRVSGPDARGFLQNVLTQDLDRLDAASVLYGALLSPQGKVLADMMLWAEPEGGVLIDADRARGGDLMRRLAMYKLRANAKLEDVSERHAVLVSAAAFEGAAPDPRLADGALGWRTIADSGAGEDGAAAFEARRVALGVPDLARDAAADEVFALEALLEELNGVDFQKGCFVGQENVSRMKRRATTRKKFCPIAFEGSPPARGTPVMAGAAELGTVRTGVEGRAIALVRLDRAVSATAPLTVDGRPVRLDPPDWLILPQRDPG